jgi:rSAM/selenodomain-associated transferase 1
LSTRQSGTVLVYLKYPQPGQVKTRLAAVIGAEASAALYRRWIGIVLQQLQPLRPEVTIVGAIDGAKPEDFSPWRGFVDLWWLQPAGDLGTRLDAGFQHFHRQKLPVIAIGSDCLDIGPEIIRLAIMLLSSTDVVFAPSADGGYALVGTSRPLPGLFETIRWSTDRTLHDHLTRCDTNRWTVQFLPMLNDIDTWTDWQAYCLRTGQPLAASPWAYSVGDRLG